MNKTLDVKTRLNLWYLLVISILILFFSVIAYILLSDSLFQANIYPWDIQIAQIEKAMDGNNMVTGFTDIGQETGVDYSDKLVAIRSFSKAELIESASSNDLIQIGDSNRQPVYIDKSLLMDSKMSKDSRIWIYSFFSNSDPEDYQLLVINQSFDSTAFTLSIFRKNLLITALVTLIISGILGYFLVKKLLKPIQDITRTAREIEETDLSKRFSVSNDDELGKLAETLNHMFERLNNAFHRERQFTADASHELRTPLTVIQGESTLTLQKERTNSEYRKSLEIISEESERMSSILKRLLFLARNESNKPLDYKKINLADFLNDLIPDIVALYEQKRIKFALTVEDNLDINGESLILRELFFNIIDNAIRYSPQEVNLLIVISRKGDNACIAITDSGIGIPKEHLNHIFERFYRVNKSRSRNKGSSGLGLAISQRIASLHGGRIDVKSEEGKGSTFTVYLPL